MGPGLLGKMGLIPANFRIGKEKGLTLFELAVVAAILGILALVLLDRVLVYQEMAEKTVVELTAMNMRSGMRYRVAELMVHNQEGEIAAMVGENPVKWLEAPPPNYLGELSGPQENEIFPGNWYFDKNERELHYRVKRERHFVSGPSGKHELRFRVTSSTKRAEAGGAEMPVQGVTLTLVEPYRWF